MADDTAAATKADIKRIEASLEKMAVSLTREVQAVRTELRTRTDWLNDGINHTIKVLGSIQDDLTGKIVDHENRITRIEAGFASS